MENCTNKLKPRFRKCKPGSEISLRFAFTRVGVSHPLQKCTNKPRPASGQNFAAFRNSHHSKSCSPAQRQPTYKICYNDAQITVHTAANMLHFSHGLQPFD